MSINQDIQSLEPGAIVTLFEVDYTNIGTAGEIQRFHPYASPDVIVWQGEEYGRWPVKASGFEMTGGQSPTPRMTMGNVGGYIGALCLSFDDLNGAIVKRHRTLAKYLDGQPDADPDEHFPTELWYVEQKISENNEFVEFELSSALDFNGQQLPGRIVSQMCPAQVRYRGPRCGYSGPPVADEYDIITTDAEQDQCGKRVQSCKLRFGENEPLPHGGFPASGLL
jgi:lambda family phage minor tail protein L